MYARRVATHGSIVALPSRAGIVELAPFARASHRSASAGRPVIARNQAPYMASAGYRKLVVAEPAQPVLHRLHPAVVVEALRHPVDQTSHRVRLGRGLPVADRRLRKLVGDAPVHRATVERPRQGRIIALELGAQQLTEEMVVAVPLAVPVERHHEAVRALEALQGGGRVSRFEDRVAEVTAHTSKHRGVL